MDFEGYVGLFNTGDDAALVERFYDADIVFSVGVAGGRGHAELLRFLAWAHDGVREVMRPQTVMHGDDMVFADVDMDFHATRARPDFPLKPLACGETLTIKFFVTYRFRNGRIVELRTMNWPPEAGVTRLPRLGSHVSQQAALHAYMAAFTNAEFDSFPTFYTDDVVLELSVVPPMLGRQAIVDFYTPMFQTIRESLTPHDIHFGDDAIRMRVTSRFTATADTPDFVVAPLLAGQSIDLPLIVAYTLRDGLIAKIVVSVDGAPQAVA